MTFEQLITKYLDKVGGVVESAVNLAMEEVPVLMQEYLTWHLYEQCIGLFFSLVFLFGAPFLAKKWCSYWFIDNGNGTRFENSDGEEIIFIGTVGLGILGCIFWIIAMFATEQHVKKIIKINVAPRIYIIDQFMETTKGK